ncbi:MAG: acetylornithine transaminase [Oscillospiraceae bacterium]
MELETIKQLDEKYYMNTFGERVPLCFTEGSGITLTATDGTKYTDFFAGIAVSSLGHAHPRLTRELIDQVGKVLHTSSVYYVENQAKLAQMIVENTSADRVFFCSTGAEANEGAIKLAKKYHVMNDHENRIEFITLKNSFHGRTLATVAATGQEKYQKPYKPLIEKFVHVERNDCESLLNSVNPNTAAIMIEVIQGESGVNPLTLEFVQLARKLCDENDLILIVDEVQTGVGRCGKLFAYELFDIEPDIFTMAKGLGGGVPIGAFGAKQKVANAFSPGDHGTTFGGNPLSTRAGLVVMSELLENGLLKKSSGVGEYFGEKLVDFANNSSWSRSYARS